MEPARDLGLDLDDLWLRGAEQERRHDRADLDAIAVTDLLFAAPEQLAVQDRAVGAAQVVQEDSTLAALDAGMDLADHRRSQPELAVPVAADREAETTDGDLTSFRASDVNVEPDTGEGRRDGARDGRIDRGLEVESRATRLGDVGRLRRRSPLDRRDVGGLGEGRQDFDGECPRARRLGPGTVEGRRLVGVEADSRRHAGDREDVGQPGSRPQILSAPPSAAAQRRRASSTATTTMLASRSTPWKLSTTR